MEIEFMRISVSLPNELLIKFDKIFAANYPSRSEAIRDAINNYISYYEWMNDIRGYQIGTFTIIYNHTAHNVSNTLTKIQHYYSDIIKSSVHIYLDHDDRFEIVILKGDGRKIVEFTEAIMALKGVKFSKLTTVALTENI